MAAAGPDITHPKRIGAHKRIVNRMLSSPAEVRAKDSDHRGEG